MTEPKKVWDARILRGPKKGKFKSKLAVQRLQKRRELKRLAADTVMQANNNSRLDGREVVNTGFFSKQMWCSKCEIPLSLDLAIEKIQKGLGHIYTVKCCKCSALKKIYTDTTFGDKGEYFTVNAKLAMGIMDAGVGETQLNLLLSAMNFAPLTDSLYKRYERMVGKYVEAVAKESCSESLEEEKLLTKSANDIVEDK